MISEQSISSTRSEQNGSVRLRIEQLQFLDNGPYSFDIKKKECVGLSGQSGIGKTQLLRAITDLIPHRGQLLLDGAGSSTFPAPVWRSKVTMIPAESFWWYERVGDHFPLQQKKQSIVEQCESVGFADDVLGWQVGRLSTGEKQRLALIRGLCNTPVVLLLDEPCSALDEYHTKLIESLVLQYIQDNKSSVLWVSHDPDQLHRVADREFSLLKNKLIEK